MGRLIVTVTLEGVTRHIVCDTITADGPYFFLRTDDHSFGGLFMPDEIKSIEILKEN